MKRLLAVLLFLSGCSTTHDPHAPRTISAGDSGGEVQVKHGQRLRIQLPGAGNYAWSREEPQTPVVLAQGAPEGDVWMFTPVRSGKETLRLELAKPGGDDVKRTFTYEVEVP